MLWLHRHDSKDQQFDWSLQPCCCLLAKRAWWSVAGGNPRGWALPWGSVTCRQREGKAKADKPAAISCITWWCFLFNFRGSTNWKISSGRDCCQALTSPADDALAAAAAQNLAAQETAAALPLNIWALVECLSKCLCIGPSYRHAVPAELGGSSQLEKTRFSSLGLSGSCCFALAEVAMA